MQTVSTDFLAALRSSHTISVYAQAYRNNVPISQELNILGGSVSAAVAGAAGPRRTLNIDLQPVPGLWDALAPYGATIEVFRGIRFIDGRVERVPLGVFDVDEQNMDYGLDGTLTLTAPDLWVRVQRNRFTSPSVANGSALTAAATYASAAATAGYGRRDGDYTVTVHNQIFERDTDDAITQLAVAAGAWVYFDPRGRVATRNIPSISGTPVWTIDASQTGVLLSAGRTRSRQRTYNAVVVTAEDVNGTVPFVPVTVEDTNPDSPTYIFSSFGRVPYFYSSPLITTSTQATKAAAGILKRVRGLAAQLDIVSVVNPALEPGDVIQVLLPARAGKSVISERHVIDSVTIPLTVDGTQTIQTRSTRPEGDVPNEV